jgi:hypothetical protein
MGTLQDAAMDAVAGRVDEEGRKIDLGMTLSKSRLSSMNP